MSVEDFEKFIFHLKMQKNGVMFAALATVQCYQALRICEGAALSWEDVFINEQALKRSIVRITKKVEWPRRKGMKSKVVEGFKNSRSLGGMKEQPLAFKSYQALLSLNVDIKRGLIFRTGEAPLEYRQVQYAYDKAFKSAGLNYSATHVMRRSGTSWIFDDTKDIGLAGQLLGDTDLKVIMKYAKRNQTALKEHYQTVWDEKSGDTVAANGRKSEKPA
jgi:integrase